MWYIPHAPPAPPPNTHIREYILSPPFRSGDLDDREVEVEVPQGGARLGVGGGPFGDGSGSIQEVMIRVDRMFGGRGGARDKRKMKVRQVMDCVCVGGGGLRYKLPNIKEVRIRATACLGGRGTSAR